MDNRARTYSLVIEPQDEGGFFAYFPALPNCYAKGISYEGTVEMAEEALALYLDDLKENGITVPEETIEAPLSLSVTVRET